MKRPPPPPPPPQADADAPTRELCREEYRGGHCMLDRGHDGPHECLLWNRLEPMRLINGR